jgi:hypothetical protein
VHFHEKVGGKNNLILMVSGVKLFSKNIGVKGNLPLPGHLILLPREEAVMFRAWRI